MSTRSCILRPGIGTETPTGVYAHWDGYPSGVGAALYDAIATHFKGDVEAALKYLIDDHPAGWSSVAGVDWDLEPGFEDDNEVVCTTCGRRNWEHYKQYYQTKGRRLPRGASKVEGYVLFGHTPMRDYAAPRRPQCYCHGARSEEPQPLTLAKAASWGCEYAYVISPETRTMYVLSSYTQDGEKMIGMFGMGDEDASWRLLAAVDLDGPEPDWEQLGKDEEENQP